MKLKYLAIGLTTLLNVSCNFLDVIPDNISTVDMAFNTKVNAEKYLATCYNFVPAAANLDHSSGMICGGEMWYLKSETSNYYRNTTSFNVARGLQNTNDPLLNYWSGGHGGYNLFRGIHECNVFIANIDNVPDMYPSERENWKAEVKTLKAYYLYYLMLHYGPIPLLKSNLETDSDLDMMHLNREPIDNVVAYIIELLDQAILSDALPLKVLADQTDLGRITMPIAKAIKAKVLVLAASPLFNGNDMYKDFVNKQGEHFFNQTYSEDKWILAADACLDAITTAHQAGIKLYKFDERLQYDPTQTTMQELTLRNTITERFNSEVVWALGDNATTSLQDLCQPHLSSYALGNRMSRSSSQLAPPIEIVEQFYSNNGVPINEDMEYEYYQRYELTETPENPYLFAQEYKTIKLHLNREPRFYAYIGFDGGRWFSLESCLTSDDNPYPVKSKMKDLAGYSDELSSSTGYFTKKLVSYRNINTQVSNVNYSYSFPIIRLADLYLLYSEALNECKLQPDSEVYKYIQLVRDKAGLDNGGSLVDTWAQHSTNPTKPTTKEGMKEIIRRERMIELAFEGQRYHDVRRWKLGSTYLNTPIKGWSVLEEQSEYFYKERVMFKRSFMPRDYFWPIKISDLNKNPNLIQNPQW